MNKPEAERSEVLTVALGTTNNLTTSNQQVVVRHKPRACNQYRGMGSSVPLGFSLCNGQKEPFSSNKMVLLQRKILCNL
jgi:hypothetical protein